ncbi:hypothetical protein N8I77_010947 [Diaporthe amygdali]|uniref:Uncharacterized protein n=1 Tax=Phomopsis amygdali TaxID=1214568 RepID=A0AAD9S843_PHOAM|nr:hypothetical protein N8I77_010947 [Diaporthe amygdali]
MAVSKNKSPLWTSAKVPGQEDGPGTPLLATFFWTIFNTVWFGANLLHTNSFGKSSIGGPTLVEPKEAPIETVKVRWDLPAGKRSDFTSYDRAVADAAWASRGLGESQGWLKVSKEDLDAMGETSVEFEDGSGYLMYVDVFQQLHCLNYLRKKLDPWKASYPSVGSDSTFPEGYHTAHCIDSIRLSLECHADVSMVPQRWADGWLEPWPVVQSQHVCRDYSKIQECAHGKQPYVSGKLFQPKLGKVVNGSS